MKHCTFLPGDVTLLLTDITGRLQPLPAEIRERRIQSGTHYSEMLPLEYEPSARYLAEYSRALEAFAAETAAAVAETARKIYAAKGGSVALVSLARAGTPAGVLIKRYFRAFCGFDPPHYTISIVRGRGIDAAAMRVILAEHAPETLQFVDGWTGKGAILGELESALSGYPGFEGRNRREILAVLADPANITDVCGTHDDLPIASSFLNATVCGLMSRTVMPNPPNPDEFHGVAFYPELASCDKTYEFIGRVEREFSAWGEASNGGCGDSTGLDEVRRIAAEFAVRDINFVKPGIGEATRVLLRRVPDVVLVAESAEERYVAHIAELAREKGVPVVRYPLERYRACGIIKDLGDL